MIFFLLQVLVYVPAVSQELTTGWVKGNIVLENQEAFPVILQFNSHLTEGLLQVYEDGQVVSLSPDKIHSFSFYDSLNKQERVFISLAVYSAYYDYTRSYFMELLYQNSDLMLLKREFAFLFSKNFDNPRNFGSYEVSYFFDIQKEQLLTYTIETNLGTRTNKKLLHNLLDSDKNEVKNYIRNNHLNYKDLEDVLQVLGHFQTKQQQVTRTQSYQVPDNN